MDLNILWVNDPKDSKPSVSLTLMLASMLACLIASSLEMFDLVKSTSMTFEMFGACSGLYFGRKWTSSKGQVVEKE